MLLFTSPLIQHFPYAFQLFLCTTLCITHSKIHTIIVQLYIPISTFCVDNTLCCAHKNHNKNLYLIVLTSFQTDMLSVYNNVYKHATTLVQQLYTRLSVINKVLRCSYVRNIQHSIFCAKNKSCVLKIWLKSSTAWCSIGAQRNCLPRHN